MADTYTLRLTEHPTCTKDAWVMFVNKPLYNGVYEVYKFAETVFKYSKFENGVWYDSKDTAQ